MSEDGSRTHEPSLREAVSELDGLRKLILSKLQALRDVIDERDRLYKERDDAHHAEVNAAVLAVKEETKARFEASEKAIVKAEDAQKAYNQSHNDLTRKMDEQNKATMPRPEIESRFRSLEEKLSVLRSAIDRSEAGGKGQRDMWGWIVAAVATIVSIFSLVWRRL